MKPGDGGGPMPVLIAGGGPAGLALALMLARRRVRSTVLDARPLDAARADPRLLALSRGTLQALRPLVVLRPEAMAPIRSVVVSSAGEFGRVRIGADDVGGEAGAGAGREEPLGATVRYGDLLVPLAQACEASEWVTVHRPCRVLKVRQRPQQVLADVDPAANDAVTLPGSLLVHAEGGADAQAATPAAFAQVAVLADVAVAGVAPGCAHERFTRDGPLALLPTPATPGATSADGARTLSLVWCMPSAHAQRRMALPEADFIAELQAAVGVHNGRVLRVGPRSSHALQSHARSTLHQHRVAWIGNAAQSLHPVAGQGLNLGLRDCAELSESIAQAVAEGRDPATALPDYARRRRADRTTLITLTRNAPALFASRAAPIALGRSLALSALSMIPELRREFARLLMFGVRA